MNSNGQLSPLLCLWLLGLPALVGCGDGSTGNAIVQGTVTIDGQLAKSGNVVFHSAGDAPAAYGSIRSDGTYALRVGRGNPNNADASKIQAGEYVATVQILGPATPDEEFEGAPPKPGPLLIAEKFTKKSTSGLAHTIKAGRNIVNLELESPSEEELAARAEAAAARASEIAAAKEESNATESEGPPATVDPSGEQDDGANDDGANDDGSNDDGANDGEANDGEAKDNNQEESES